MRAEKPLIVFDLDGTLLDSYELALRCHAFAIEAVGLPPVSLAVLESLNGPTIEEECAILGLPPERMSAYHEAIVRSEREVAPPLVRAFPGVPEMLSALEARATLCVLTNGLDSYLRMVCGLTGIARFFSESAAFAAGVPKAARIRRWLEARGMPPALAVGDRPSDVSAGREAGAGTLAVTYGNGEAAQLAHADALADTVDEVRAYCEIFVKNNS